jgi:hypothetical protein
VCAEAIGNVRALRRRAGRGSVGVSGGLDVVAVTVYVAGAGSIKKYTSACAEVRSKPICKLNVHQKQGAVNLIQQNP